MNAVDRNRMDIGQNPLVVAREEQVASPTRSPKRKRKDNDSSYSPTKQARTEEVARRTIATRDDSTTRSGTILRAPTTLPRSPTRRNEVEMQPVRRNRQPAPVGIILGQGQQPAAVERQVVAYVPPAPQEVAPAPVEERREEVVRQAAPAPINWNRTATRMAATVGLILGGVFTLNRLLSSQDVTPKEEHIPLWKRV